MKILVTGASGFIGSALVAQLEKSGRRFVPLRRAYADSASGSTWNPQASQIRLESAGPVYPAEHFPDEYCKFLLPGIRRVFPSALSGERVGVTGKVGQAYGFTIENRYFRNPANGRAVFVAAVIYANADGVLNDDKYKYGTTAEPFLADLGEVVARRCLSP